MLLTVLRSCSGDGSVRYVLMLAGGLQAAANQVISLHPSRRAAHQSMLSRILSMVSSYVQAEIVRKGTAGVTSVVIENAASFFETVRAVLTTVLRGTFRTSVLTTLTTLVIAWIKS